MSRLALVLRIDNLDRLPDGGPVSVELDRRGIDIGRDPYLDWTLPDPERFISGKHCEIRYRDGGYWLHDVSTNGTTVNGRPGRLTEPHRLEHGDRLHIGHYIIAVELIGEHTASPSQAASPAAPPGGNVWSDVPDAAAAVDRRDFDARARPQPEGSRGPADLSEEDIGWSIGALSPGASAPDDVWGAPAAERETATDDWGWLPPAGPPAGPAAGPAAEPGQVRGPEAAPDRRGPTGVTAPVVDAQAHDPFAPDAPSPDHATGAPASDSMPPPRREPSAPDLDAASASAAAAGAPSAAPTGSGPGAAGSGLADQWADGQTARPAAGEGRAPMPHGDFVVAFERGAGLPAGAVADRADEAFAEELGALFRLVTERLQAMLLARAETKSAIRSSERTMINALENNPLKFSPTPEDALRIMFGAKSRSYLDAPATVAASFDDLQRHQIQTFAAMQGALQALIEDLDPKNIADATAEDSGLAALVGSRRAKFWDTYVERFRAKSARHERGMIDAFMILFAEMYDRQR